MSSKVKIYYLKCCYGSELVKGCVMAEEKPKTYKVSNVNSNKIYNSNISKEAMDKVRYETVFSLSMDRCYEVMKKYLTDSLVFKEISHMAEMKKLENKIEQLEEMKKC